MMQPAVLDKVLHLGLFVAGAVAVAVGALALLERFAGRGRTRAIHLRHLAIPIAAFAAFGIAERLYHALS
jgi:hypothetical protein